MLYLHILILIFVIIITFAYILSLFNNIKYKIPQVSTFNRDLEILKRVFDKYIIKGKKIADLGSGTGKMLRLFERRYRLEATGFEIDFSNVLISKIISKSFGLKNKSIKKNYFDAELEEFDYIYIYMLPFLMEKVEKKVWSSCKKGTIIFVNAFKFTNHKPIEIYKKNGKDKIFVYEV